MGRGLVLDGQVRGASCGSPEWLGWETALLAIVTEPGQGQD